VSNSRGDILIRDIEVSKSIQEGDLFAIFNTGAYGYSMASNYNRNLIPPVVLIEDGRSRLIVKGQTYEELLFREMR
jgi:diaminopimelate decarboxylase